MASAIIFNEGQVIIPKEIRDYLKLATGSKVDFANSNLKGIIAAYSCKTIDILRKTLT